MLSFRFAGLAPICCAALLFSQTQPQSTPPARAADAVIRVSVDLVEVDALVTDSKGRHVADLKPEDFTILEDGKPQKITQFAYVNPAPDQIALAAHAVSGEPAVTSKAKLAPAVNPPAANPRREDVHRTIVLVIDNLHTHTDDIGVLQPALKKFIDEQVSPGDLVSVMATKSGMGIYESFTSDKRQLQAAIDKVLRMPGDNRPQESIAGNPTPGTDPISSDSGNDALYFINLYNEMAMNTLSRAIEGIRDIPGRKAIVFFSDGIMIPAGVTMETSELGFEMSDRAREVTELANQSGVVLDTFDPGGLLTPMSLSRPMGGMPSKNGLATAQGRTPSKGSHSGGLPNQPPMGQRADAMALNEIPAFLARETGGIAVKNTNDLSGALGKAMDDMTGYYLMGYQPKRDDMKPGDAEKEHRIQVKVRRSGLTVRSRKGYTAAADEVTEAGSATREQQLGKALFSPFVAGGVALHLTPLYSASAPDEKTNRRQPLLRAALAVEGRDVQFKDAPDGGKQAILDIVVAVYDAADRRIASQDKRYTLQATAAQAEAFRTGMIDYQLDVPIPSPGAYQLRAAVRDDATGKLGSAYTFLMIPDFNKPQLELSSLVLGDPKGGEAQVASRQFTAGGQLSYGCQVFGAQTAGAGSSVDIEVRLFRNGGQVYASHVMPLMVPAGMKEIPVAGSLKLPPAFAPGEYAMEFIARDKVATSGKQAVQWTDFSIAGATPTSTSKSSVQSNPQPVNR